MITERQGKILNDLIKEYIDGAEPVSSQLLKKRCGLDISSATIRNELQELTGQGYISQPHTSAGRVPTPKAYRYFVEIIFEKKEAVDLEREIHRAQEKIEKELKLVKGLAESLTEISAALSYTRLEDKDSIFEMLKIIGPSQASHDKNISLISELLEEIENF